MSFVGLIHDKERCGCTTEVCILPLTWPNHNFKEDSSQEAAELHAHLQSK